MNKIKKKTNNGSILLLLLFVIFIFSITMFPIINWAVTQSKVIKSNIAGEQALQIAEAGINYYQWHLAHFPTDYQDGTGTTGPYLHNYTDLDNETVIGQYSLSITAPATGSTIVTIASTGWTSENPQIKRTITAKYGIPSLALYSFLSNDVIWIGSSETVNGQMQSNNGIRFDGVGNAPISSAKSAYRVFALVMPQGRIVIMADTEVYVADALLTVGAKLDARIKAAAAAGKDVTALNAMLTDLGAKASDAKVQAQAAIELIANLQPDQGDKAKMEANNKALADARAKLKVGHEDLKAARANVTKIMNALKAMKLDAPVAPAAPSSSN
jgi:hypothetical protein